MRVERLQSLFGSLRALLLPMVEQIADQPQPESSFLRQHFDEGAQLKLGRTVLEKMGYDFERGRQDRTRHPFMARFASDDVRITTRVKSTDLERGPVQLDSRGRSRTLRAGNRAPSSTAGR